MEIVIADLSHLNLLIPLFDGYRVFYKQPSDLRRAEAFLRDRLEKKDSVIFLAKVGKTGLGFTQLYYTFSSVTTEPFLILNDLFVSPEARGQKIGERLLLSAQEYAQSHQMKGVALETAHDNPAQKLYERLGWKRDQGFLHYFWLC